MASFLAAMILLVTTGLFVWRLSSFLDVLSRFGHAKASDDTFAKLDWKH